MSGQTPRAGDEAGTQRSTRRRGGRRVVRVSEVDRRLIEQGLPPSWEERIGPEDVSAVDGSDPDRGDGANDRRLLDNVPPHSQPRT
ncbi:MULTISPECIES: toxin [Actinomyces]|uniref:toxin n=1 Tax=Actinomyces TaxID=1654 RepID=UPI00096A4DB1|nr:MULTISPECIES: toxin [Actinomyces]